MSTSRLLASSTTKRAFSSCTCARSHVGSAPIPLPPSVTISAVSSPTRALRVAGPHGTLDLPIEPFVRITTPSPDQIQVEVQDSLEKKQRAMWGTTRAHLANYITGVSSLHSATVSLVGVGYRAALEDRDLVVRLGYPNPVRMTLPEGVQCEFVSPTNFTLKGADKHMLGAFTAKLRAWRKPEPYNGKGVFVNGETIKRKEPKKK